MKSKRHVVLRREDHQFSRGSAPNSSWTVKYWECQRNHAANVGGYAVDGCREFMPSGDESGGGGGGGALTCAACGCHRNFHRREVEAEVVVCEGSNDTC